MDRARRWVFRHAIVRRKEATVHLDCRITRESGEETEPPKPLAPPQSRLRQEVWDHLGDVDRVSERNEEVIFRRELQGQILPDVLPPELQHRGKIMHRSSIAPQTGQGQGEPQTPGLPLQREPSGARPQGDGGREPCRGPRRQDRMGTGQRRMPREAYLLLGGKKANMEGLPLLW